MRDFKKPGICIIVVTIIYLLCVVFLTDMISNNKQTYSEVDLSTNPESLAAILSSTYDDFFSVDSESISVEGEQISGIYLKRDGTEVPYVMNTSYVSDNDDGKLYLLLIAATIFEIGFVLITIMSSFYKKALLEDRLTT